MPAARTHSTVTVPTTPAIATLFTGARVIDPDSGFDSVADLAVDASGRIAALGPRLSRAPAARVIDADGLILAPGLIDPHVHLREPGGEAAETIATGTAAAVRGGFTTVCCMPNTTPALDDDAMVEFIERQAELTGCCRVFTVGAVTKGRRGEELAEIHLMARAGESDDSSRRGAVGFSDDGDCVASSGIMARALTYIKPTGLALMQHCQEMTLTYGASMHAGSVAARLGLTGWPRIAEELIIERDLRINRGIGCRYHVQHLSSGGSVEIVRRARAEGLPITAEASPHHLLLTHEAVLGPGHGGVHPDAAFSATAPDPASPAATIDPHTAHAAPYWTFAKMNPPLRERADIDAMLRGISDGTISVLATDHAPHTPERKALDFESAPFGITGLETALPLYIEALVTAGVIGWPRLIALLTIEPARLCALDSRLGLGRLAVGGPADLTLIDPDERWTIDAQGMAGRSRNTPFHARPVRGRAVATVVAGAFKMDRVGDRVRGRAR